MIMEDYKKKYEQALERAKGAHNSAKSDKENGVTDKITEYTIQLTETIFPELKESEDEKIRKAILELVKQSSYILNPMNQKSMIAWLEKQKPAWSEEDERYYDSALWHIKNSCGKEGNVYNWLKSIKKRYIWKPSDEQIEALKDALNDAIWQYDFKGSPLKEEVTRKHAETIESLYNDLKKLREE